MSIRRIALALTSFCTVSCALQPGAVSETPKSSLTWNSDLNMDYLWTNSNEGKKAIQLVEAKQGVNKGYGRIKVGNMAFIEAMPNPDPLGREMQSTYYAAIFNESISVVNLPNDELLAQYIEGVRKNPNILSKGTQINLLFLLAIGRPDYLTERSDNGWSGGIVKDPEWHEENGDLIIEYFAGKSSGMQKPTAEKCKLIITKSQNRNVECNKL